MKKGVKMSFDSAELARLSKMLKSKEKEINKEAYVGLANIALNIINQAKTTLKEVGAIKTGFLRDSGYVRKDKDDQVEAGFKATYAAFIEFGTTRMKGRPFLYPAMRDNEKEIERVISEAIKKIL